MGLINIFLHFPRLECAIILFFFLSHKAEVRQQFPKPTREAKTLTQKNKKPKCFILLSVIAARLTQSREEEKKMYSYSVLLGCLPWPRFHVKLHNIYCSTTMRVAIKAASGSAHLCIYTFNVVLRHAYRAMSI